MIEGNGGLWIAIGLLTLAGAIFKASTVLLKWHSDFLYYMAEHEILVEDFAERKEITRHNVKTMAMAANAARGRGNGAVDRHV